MAVQLIIWHAPSRQRHFGTDVGHYLRHLDHLMLAAVAGLVGYGLWTSRRSHVTTSAATRILPRPRRDLRRIGVVALEL